MSIANNYIDTYRYIVIRWTQCLLEELGLPLVQVDWNFSTTGIHSNHNQKVSLVASWRGFPCQTLRVWENH